MRSASSKRKKPAKKAAARSGSPGKAAQRAARGAPKPAAARSGEAETDLVYSDIRRSMHGAILRHLR
jgi:hypothetical protein